MAALAALMCLGLTACGGDSPSGAADSGAAAEQQPVEMLAFTSPSGTFAVNIPDVEGGWTQTSGGNEESIVLDNEDQSFSILVQGLPKEQASQMFQTMDDLITYYRSTTLSTLGEPTEETISAPNATAAKAESYAVTQNGVTVKALVAYLETGKGYYAYTITGLSDIYDAEIDAQRDAIAGFEEPEAAA